MTESKTGEGVATMTNGDPDLHAYHKALTLKIGEKSTLERGTVSTQMIARYAYATGQTNPIYFDADQAKFAGYSSVVAPPNFLSSIFDWSNGPPESELNPDGTPPAVNVDPARATLRGMGAGEELEIVNDVYADTNIKEEEELIKASLKVGRTGESLFVTTQHTFSDDQGRVLNVNRRTVVYRPAHDGTSS